MKLIKPASLLISLVVTRLAWAGAPIVAAPAPYIFNETPFTEARHLTEGSIDTSEYVFKGENLTNWTQLVTHQHISFSAAADKNNVRADEYVGLLWQELSRDAKAQPNHWTLLFSSETAAVFSVRFEATEGYPAQTLLGLVIVGGGEMNVVEWAVKPEQCEPATLERKRESWEALLVKQAKNASTQKAAS